MHFTPSHRMPLAQAEFVEPRRLLSSSLSGGVLTLTGTSNNDVISVTLSGNTNIKVTDNGVNKYYSATSVAKIIGDAKAGNDALIVQEAVNRPTSLVGGTGNDFVSGGMNKDTLRGGDGNDTVDGHSGDDVVDGQVGDDRVIGGFGKDALLGGSGNDWLIGGNGADSEYVEGGSGTDTVDYAERVNVITAFISSVRVGVNGCQLTGKGGQAGEIDTYNGIEVINGGAAGDNLTYNSGLDGAALATTNLIRLFGNGGNDTLTAVGYHENAASDRATLYGGDGNDAIESVLNAAPRTEVYGQAGNDRLNINDEDFVDPVVMDLGSGTDTLIEDMDGVGHVSRTLPGTIENYEGSFAIFSSIVITGNALNNRIQVTVDTSGTVGATILGNAGNDVLIGTSVNDALLGHAGNDTIYGSAGNDAVQGGTGNDLVFGGTGNDVLYGGDGTDVLSGDAGADRIFGEIGDDTIKASDGAKDSLYGGTGTDKAYRDAIDVLDSIEA